MTLHRLVKKKIEEGHGKVVFMIPGTWGIGGWLDISSKKYSTMVYLANNGYDVYTLEFRSAFLPNMDYDRMMTNGLNIEETASWTYALFREDLKACVEKIKKKSESSRLFISGFSRGGILMFIYAAKYPDDIIGLVSLDGGLKIYHQPDLKLNQNEFKQQVQMLKSNKLKADKNCILITCPKPGDYYSMLMDVGIARYDNWMLAGQVPWSGNLAGKPLPREYQTISDFVAHDAYYAWGKGVLTNYYEKYMDRDVLVKVLGSLDRFYPVIQDLETLQLLGHYNVPYFDYDVYRVNLPVIAFLSPMTCPDKTCLNDQIPNYTQHKDVTLKYLRGYGHLDVLYGSKSLKHVKKPLLQWLNDHI